MLHQTNDSGHLQRRLSDQVDTGVELPELVMTATRICKDFYAIQSHKNMRAVDR